MLCDCVRVIIARVDGTGFGEGRAGLWEAKVMRSLLPDMQEEEEEEEEEKQQEALVEMAVEGAQPHMKCEKGRALESTSKGDRAWRFAQ